MSFLKRDKKDKKEIKEEKRVWGHRYYVIDLHGYDVPKVDSRVWTEDSNDYRNVDMHNYFKTYDEAWEMLEDVLKLLSGDLTISYTLTKVELE